MVAGLRLAPWSKGSSVGDGLVFEKWFGWKRTSKALD
jgi:hypothetical protein